MKNWHIVLIVAVVILALVLFFVPRNYRPPQYSQSDYPWSVHPVAGGRSEVFGLTLGASTLGDADKRFGKAPVLGLFESRSGKLSLEAYYQELTLGPLSAKVVLGLAADKAMLEAMRQNATDRKRVDSGDNRYILSAADHARARSLPIASLTYIPYVDLDESMVDHRFGRPAERMETAAGVHHLLYPKLGLDLILNDNGKEVLQYVAPRDFERVRAPLIEAARRYREKLKQPAPDK
ncbi:MAG: hypothetical protein P8009_04630 [Gammaproteobacteria bacterium]